MVVLSPSQITGGVFYKYFYGCYSFTLCDTIMIGKLDPEENVMNGNLEPEEPVGRRLENHLAAKRKAIAVCNQGVVQDLYDTIAELGWDCYDDIVLLKLVVHQVSGIDGATTKWAVSKSALASTTKMLYCYQEPRS